MKKLFKKILLFFGALTLFIILFGVAYLVRSRAAIKKMTPVETMQITGDVYAIKDSYVNMYLVKDGNHYIAIDAGNKKGNVKDGLKQLDIDADRVKAVLLTHSDADHTGALSLFGNAKVYLPREEEQLINGTTGRFLFFGNKLPVKDYELVDDKRFSIGDIKILPIAVPGHTPGATCYVINDKYLFTGDALSLTGDGIGLFPKFINKSARGARRSMKKMTDLDGVQYIFTGHYGYSDNYSAAVKNWR
jgi:glyoxylase-like metal-dependent hydrolase (beta-lactamase superfamily II)